MLGMHSCEMSLSSTLEGGGHIRTSIRSRKMKIDFAILNSMYRLRMPISTAYSMCEANKSTAQPKDDDLTEHYEFNWCLRSPLGGRLLMQSVTQYHHDVLRTRCEGGPTGGGNITPPAGGPKNGPLISNTAPRRQLVKYTAYHRPTPFPLSRVLAVITQESASSPTLLYFAKDFAS